MGAITKEKIEETTGRLLSSFITAPRDDSCEVLSLLIGISLVIRKTDGLPF
ncbi:hypothetical protein AXFE_10970 [Acidithrix ferrooxidans]|uniref:Uncharacterized protein n=1 Tax=Acidithrix ferrooxidans TaxID=1280514 RepID=A0A0D8HJ69_9ACTN|nr:hypothetical protein AXFE_10970 [Acidithrix ferrooxidans]